MSQRENNHIESHLMSHMGFTTTGYLDHKYSIQEYNFGYNMNLFLKKVVSISWYSETNIFSQQEMKSSFKLIQHIYLYKKLAPTWNLVAMMASKTSAAVSWHLIIPD